MQCLNCGTEQLLQVAMLLVLEPFPVLNSHAQEWHLVLEQNLEFALFHILVNPQQKARVKPLVATAHDP